MTCKADGANFLSSYRWAAEISFFAKSISSALVKPMSCASGSKPSTIKRMGRHLTNNSKRLCLSLIFFRSFSVYSAFHFGEDFSAANATPESKRSATRSQGYRPFLPPSQRTEPIGASLVVKVAPAHQDRVSLGVSILDFPIPFDMCRCSEAPCIWLDPVRVGWIVLSWLGAPRIEGCIHALRKGAYRECQNECNDKHDLFHGVSPHEGSRPPHEAGPLPNTSRMRWIFPPILAPESTILYSAGDPVIWVHLKLRLTLDRVPGYEHLPLDDHIEPV